MTTLAHRLGLLGRAARARTGADDVHHLKALKWSCRAAEVLGRLSLHFAAGPVGWLVGTLALAYQLSVEAQLNHSIMHGAYVGLPGAGRFVPSRYETLAIPFRSKTWRDAHRIHHQHPSIVEDDPDTLHAFFRVHPSVRWRPWHLFNGFIGAFFTFEQWAFDYDRFLKRVGERASGDRREWLKLSLYVAWQLVLFPALAGERWLPVLLGGVVAIVIRNLVFTGLQTASSVGHAVSTSHALGPGPFDQRTRFQVETSKNFVLRGWLTRVLCGGLDRHIEHHLWPHLPPRRLAALSPAVRAACAEHGIRYEEHRSFWSSLADSASYLTTLGRAPPP